MVEASDGHIPVAGEALEGPIRISTGHQLDTFDCGSPALNEWLQKYARQNEKKRAARTYVVSRGKRVVGYYTLAMAEVAHDSATPRIQKGLGKYPVPVILLARLAVDKSEQNRKLGRALLKHAFRQAIQASEVVGCRAILVHAKDEGAKAFYLQFGFEPSPTNPLHLLLPMHVILDNFA